MSAITNAELRERYLRFLSNLTGKNAEFEMFEKTTVSGKIAAVKGDGTHFLVSELKTPIGVQDIAALRTSDTLAVTAKFPDLTQ